MKSNPVAAIMFHQLCHIVNRVSAYQLATFQPNTSITNAVRMSQPSKGAAAEWRLTIVLAAIYIHICDCAKFPAVITCGGAHAVRSRYSVALVFHLPSRVVLSLRFGSACEGGPGARERRVWAVVQQRPRLRDRRCVQYVPGPPNQTHSTHFNKTAKNAHAD
eukprot:scaffold93340_cov18-Prasinocladus_malaysianus.AAC.1